MKQFSQSGLIKNSRGKNGRDKSGRQSGYILLMMLLFIALMAIAALAALPSMEMQVKRDREEEMIHRGAQYARAIRHYVKKFGRYPTSIADLQDTNDVHFLRKAYKDPITGKDFRLLHMGDVQMLMAGAGFGGGAGNPAAAAGAGQPGMPAGVPITSSNTNSGATTQGDNSASPDNSGTNGNGDNSSTASAGAGQSSDASSPNGSSSNGPSGGPGGQVFGGGPIMGVASASKDKTIRKFNNKEHYNEWLFVYDPTNDRSLITGPYQPSLMGQGIGQAVGAANGTGIQSTRGFGNQVNTGTGMQPMQPQNPGTSPFQH
jgi:type II secretory pathway pseudopilin PulG